MSNNLKHKTKCTLYKLSKKAHYNLNMELIKRFLYSPQHRCVILFLVHPSVPHSYPSLHIPMWLLKYSTFSLFISFWFYQHCAQYNTFILEPYQHIIIPFIFLTKCLFLNITYLCSLLISIKFINMVFRKCLILHSGSKINICQVSVGRENGSYQVNKVAS